MRSLTRLLKKWLIAAQSG